MPDDWFVAMGHIKKKSLQLMDYPNRARAIDLALASHGVALADSKVVAADLAAGLLVQINPLTVPSRKNLYVVFSDTTHPDPRLLAFAEWFKTVLQEP
jgi:LysR family glycine cleavage system transcriptional activator